jgi:hypothetical protein
MPRRALPSRARRARRTVLHPGRIERRAPALLVIPRELKVVALAGHANSDPSDAGPRIQPAAQRLEGSVLRGHRAPGESDSSTQESATLVEHALLDHQRQGLRNSPLHLMRLFGGLGHLTSRRRVATPQVHLLMFEGPGHRTSIPSRPQDPSRYSRREPRRPWREQQCALRCGLQRR